jgi:hypothetical protein
MRKTAKLANALALRDNKSVYWFNFPPVSEIDKYTALFEGEETANKAKLVKGYRLDFSNPYAGPETSTAGVGIPPNWNPPATLK